MSDDQDQLEFAADDARHSSSTSHPGKYHEMMDNIEELKDFITEQAEKIKGQSDLILRNYSRLNEQSNQIKTLQDGLEDMRARYIAAQKVRVEMGQFHAGFGTDSVVIPKDELRDKLNSLRMADPAFASWYSLRDMALGITKYFEEKIGQK